MISNTKLSNLQLEILRLFSYQLSDVQLHEIRELLSKYFAEKVTNDIDKLWFENNWTNETMDTWLNEHNRISYSK
jgi:hypothetical protein